MDTDVAKSNSTPMNPLSSKTKSHSDYVFVHTDSHREFMDLLLEKRKELEEAITSKEKARRLARKSQVDSKKPKPKNGNGGGKDSSC